jgi:hypothetical protein
MLSGAYLNVAVAQTILDHSEADGERTGLTVPFIQSLLETDG